MLAESRRVINVEKNDGRLRNPQFLQEGRLEARATSVPALHSGVYFKNKEESELIQILNGDFKFSYQSEDNCKDFHNENFNDNMWDILPVPSMWQYHGYGKPAYPNVEYPIPLFPPYVACENPVGYYRKKFASKKSKRSILYFGGVDNAFYVYLNGQYVGFSKGSRMPAEFDVSDILRDGENLLCVKVFTYSDATYLENQDMLLASGIFRDVMIYHLGEVTIWDYYIRTEKEKILIDVFLEGESLDGYYVRVSAAGALQKKIANRKLSFVLKIENALKWNAENPFLYNVKLELFKEEKVVECHSKKIGFVNYRISDNKMLVNNTPITIKGINRHEHDVKNGRAISVELIEKELTLIKEYNMNAVRTAHYPQHPAFYEIASELGIYVMDEADIETHGCSSMGDQGWLSKRPEWLDAYIDRTRRMLERDKNETCIFMWSTGNEHGSGENVDKCVEYIRSTPYKKPVQCSCDNRLEPRVSDFRMNAYFNMESLKSYPEHGKPVILLEYGHAMGNSPGLMEDSWDYIYTHRHIVGGFLWEFKNHGFYQCDNKGREFYQYGGDFGDINHWSNFSMDGYCLSDGTPKPSLNDCKNVLAPTYVTYDGKNILLTNTNDFKTLDYLTMKWELCEDYKVLKNGEEKLSAVNPYETIALTMDTKVVDMVPGAKYMVNMRFYDEKQSEIAYKQVVLKQYAPKKKYKSEEFSTEIRESGTNVKIVGNDFKVAFEGGILCKYEKNDKCLLNSKMQLNFYRAPIDNDGVYGWRLRWIEKWDYMFLNHFKFYAVSAELEEKQDSVILRVKGRALPTGRYIGFDIKINYTIYKEGIILVEIEGQPYGKMPEVLPRIGVFFEIDREYDKISWYGRGVEENYSDRKAHCNLGYYEQSVDQMNFMYDVPQECGTRIDTSFVKLSGKNTGLSVIGADTFSFSYHNFTLEDLTAARHRNELKKACNNVLYLDYCMRGIGSHSCGPDPEECYELRPHDFRFVFGLSGGMEEEQLLNLSRMKFQRVTERLSHTYVDKEIEEVKSVLECNID